jgi:AmiR/NasT family two-component response regulator
LRLRNETIGSLNLFSLAEPSLTDADLAVAQAMADIATIGILHERAVRDSRNVSAQLQGALNSRVLIEQAKGIVAEHSHVDVDEAFVRIRAYARSHNRRLADTAADLVEQKLRPDALIVASPSEH